MAKKKNKKTTKKNDDALFDNLAKLFRAGTAYHHLGRKKIDIESIGKQKNDRSDTNLVRRFRGIHRNRVKSGFKSFTLNRKMRYRDYEVMDTDSLVSSALDIYGEECTLKSDDGEVLTIMSDKEKIKEELETLFFDTLNFEFNAFPWIRNLCKYGDFFLILEIEPGEGVIDVLPFSVYEMERNEEEIEQGPRKGKKKIRFEIVGRSNTIVSNKLENYEVVHFRLLSDTNYLPYGKSILENGRRTWKQLKLMEDAMMVYRIMRAPERRIFYVNVGSLPIDEVDNWMEKFTTKIKKEPIIDRQTGELDLKYNVQNTLEDFFFPVRGNEQNTRIDTLPGGQNTDRIGDIEYLQAKLFASWKIPKSFLQFEEDLNSKANLALEDIRFSRSVERVQKTVEAELRKIAIIHLFAKDGFTDEDLTKFDLGLTHSSTLQEQQLVELLERKIGLIDSAKRDKILPMEYLYKKIFQMSDKDIDDIRKQLMRDAKMEYVLEELSRRGENPLIKSEEEDEEEGEESGGEDRDAFSFEVDLGLSKQDKTPGTEYDSSRVLGYKPQLNASANELGIHVNKYNIKTPSKTRIIQERNLNPDEILQQNLKIKKKDKKDKKKTK